MKRIYNFDVALLTDEAINELAKETGLSFVDARNMLIEILDEEYAPNAN